MQGVKAEIKELRDYTHSKFALIEHDAKLNQHDEILEQLRANA